VAPDPLAEAYDADSLAQGPADSSAAYHRANVSIRRPWR